MEEQQVAYVTTVVTLVEEAERVIYCLLSTHKMLTMDPKVLISILFLTLLRNFSRVCV